MSLVLVNGKTGLDSSMDMDVEETRSIRKYNFRRRDAAPEYNESVYQPIPAPAGARVSGRDESGRDESRPYILAAGIDICPCHGKSHR